MSNPPNNFHDIHNHQKYIMRIMPDLSNNTTYTLPGISILLIKLKHKKRNLDFHLAHLFSHISNSRLCFLIYFLDKVPYKVDCFYWLVVREVVLNHDTLSMRGIQLCQRCYLCGHEAKTIKSHVFTLQNYKTVL